MPRPFSCARAGLTLFMSAACACAWAQRAPSPDHPKSVVAETQQAAKRQGIVRAGGVTWKCSDRLCVATSTRAAAGVNTCQALAEQVGYLLRFGRVERPIPSYDLALCNVRAQIKLAKIEQQRADAEAARARRLPPRTGAAKPLTPPVVAAPRSLPVTPSASAAISAVPPETRNGIPPGASNAALPETSGVAPRVVSDAPPVVETSPIEPSYRPPVFAMRVMQLAVVGRGGVLPPEVSLPQDAVAMPVSPRVDVPPLSLVGHGRLQEVPTGTHLTVTVDKLELIGTSESKP